jgi:4-amino-4-deoxy-L-arabinose transferase-like glycosyltransferase
MTRTLLSAYVSFCAYLVLLLQLLSLFRQITFWPVLLGVVAGVALVVRVFAPHPRTWRIRIPLRAFVHPATLPFILVLPPLVVLLIVQGWHFPPNDWDAMTYHLARAAYWRQWHTLAHFNTNSDQQVAFPGNVETLFTVVLVLTHTARTVYLVQISAYLMGSLAIYGLGRQAGARPPFALFGAGLFATMPEVVLQSNGTVIDITVASFVLCAVYFFVDAAQTRRHVSVFCMGLALGLAMGAKATPLLALPGLIAEGAFLVAAHAHTTPFSRRWLLISGAVLLPAILLVAPWYVENRFDFGSFSGPPQITSLQMVQHFSLATFRLNLLRHLIAFLDPLGPAMINQTTSTFLWHHLMDLRAWLAATTGADVANARVDWPNNPYFSSPVSYFRESLSWYGFTGALVVYLSLIYTVVSIVRPRARQAALYAAGVTSYLLYTSLLLRWQPWEGHLLTTMVSLGCPVAAVVADRLATHRAASWALCLIALYAAAGAPTAAVLNQQRPLSGWGGDYNTRRAAWFQQITPLLNAMDRHVPASAHLGLMLPTSDTNNWEFPFFGRDLRRTVIPIKLPPNVDGSFAGEPTFSYAAPFSYLLTHVPSSIVAEFFASQPALHCGQLWRYSDGYGGPYTLYRCGS